MPNRFDDDDDSDLSGYYAHDSHRGGYGDDYAREGHWPGTGARGDMYGRGPKNYQRPDERIADEIHQILTDDPYLDATHIEVTVKDGEVTLSGNVANRWAKRYAEEILDGCRGVHDVQNRLTIADLDQSVHVGKASE